MDQSSRDDTLGGIRSPGAAPAGAVSSQSSRDKRRNRSAGGSSMRGEGRAISAEHNVATSRADHNWDNSREPVAVVASGDVVHFDLLMTGEGQVQESSAVEDVVWDFDTIYNLGGPVYVEGAEPGDTLEVEVLSLAPGPWGWT